MENERTPPTMPTAQQAKPKSQAQLFMELMAISGEYPAENIHRIIPSQSYAKKLITALIGDKLIKLVNKGGIRGYRLEIKGKRKLLAENPARYKEYLDGATDTNKLRSDNPRRLRLHSAAEVYTLMLNAGVLIYKDTKPLVYLLDASVSSSQSAFSQSVITTSCFYSSREQKGEDDNAIRGSRALGTLLTPTHVYAIYNTGGIESRWRESVEMRYRAEVHDHICGNLIYSQYKGSLVGGIVIGKSMDILEKYLVADAKTSAAHNFFSKTYQPFYFITNDDYGESQLKLLCDNARMTVLKTAMQKGLKPANSRYPIEHDALTEDGNPVLFCCQLNIPRLVQFRAGIQLHGKVGNVIAFDFQQELLERYLGGTAVFKTLSLEKLIERFYPF